MDVRHLQGESASTPENEALATLTMRQHLMMNVHDPPNPATASAMRSPMVAFSSMISLGFRAVRVRTSCCVA